jgi:hypothetical protein
MALQQRGGWDDDFFFGGLSKGHPLMAALSSLDTSSGKNIPVNVIEVRSTLLLRVRTVCTMKTGKVENPSRAGCLL